MMDGPPIRAIAKDQATREVVMLVFSVVGGVIVVFIIRRVHNPDFGRTIKMRLALTVKRIANRAADRCQEIADRAATAYNREKA